MEDSWVCIEDDDVSSHHSLSDSDRIDSETEAELYSKIHYEENLPSKNYYSSEHVNAQLSELYICSPHTVNDIFCAEENRETMQTHSPLLTESLLLEHVSEDNINYLQEKKNSRDRNINLKKLEQYSNSAKKRKSDSEEKSSVILSSNDSEGMNLNESSKQKLLNIKNKKARLGSHIKQNPAKKNNTIIDDSSDSDSNFIWTELDSSEKSDFKINVLDDTDTISLSSSDSDNEPDVSSPLIKRNSILKNLSMPNIKMGENSKGLWHVNNEDLYRQKKYSQRYHENIDVTCSNCNRRGHTQRTCSAPKMIKCFICGGGHVGARCVNRICSNCYVSGHDRFRCRRRPNTFFCHLCQIKGHVIGNCPDLWRRYHLTTKPMKITKAKQVQQDINLYCWNCGNGGHFGGVCPVLSSRYHFTTWPCVISYNNPEVLLKKRLNHSKDMLDNVRRNESVNRRKERLDNFRRNESRKQSKDLCVTMNISEGKKDVHFKPGNELSVAENFIEERTAGKNKGKRRTDMRFKKIQKIVRQKDFPRTPKQKKSPQKPEDNMPELAELSLKRQLRNKKKNKNRRIKRRQKKLQDQSLQNNQAKFFNKFIK